MPAEVQGKTECHMVQRSSVWDDASAVASRKAGECAAHRRVAPKICGPPHQRSLVRPPGVRWPQDSVRGDNNRGIFWIFSVYCIQHCFICRPSDSTVTEDAGIEPRTVATSALAVRRTGNNRLAKIGIVFCQLSQSLQGIQYIGTAHAFKLSVVWFGSNTSTFTPL